MKTAHGYFLQEILTKLPIAKAKKLVEILQKGFRGNHKYIRREGSPGNYKYIYRDDNTGREVEGEKPESETREGEEKEYSDKQQARKEAQIKHVKGLIAEAKKEGRSTGRLEHVLGLLQPRESDVKMDAERKEKMKGISNEKPSSIAISGAITGYRHTPEVLKELDAHVKYNDSEIKRLEAEKQKFKDFNNEEDYKKVMEIRHKVKSLQASKALYQAARAASKVIQDAGLNKNDENGLELMSQVRGLLNVAEKLSATKKSFSIVNDLFKAKDLVKEAKVILENIVKYNKEKNEKEVQKWHEKLDKLLHGYVGEAGKTPEEKDKGI